MEPRRDQTKSSKSAHGRHAGWQCRCCKTESDQPSLNFGFRASCNVCGLAKSACVRQVDNSRRAPGKVAPSGGKPDRSPSQPRGRPQPAAGRSEAQWAASQARIRDLEKQLTQNKRGRGQAVASSNDADIDGDDAAEGDKQQNVEEPDRNIADLVKTCAGQEKVAELDEDTEPLLAAKKAQLEQVQAERRSC